MAQEGFESIRLDEKLYTGEIRATVKQLLRETDAIIVDVTDSSPNVLYELGYAHANERSPLLIWRLNPAEPQPKLPFYLQSQRIAFIRNEAHLRDAVQQYFTQVRGGRS